MPVTNLWPILLELDTHRPSTASTAGAAVAAGANTCALPAPDVIGYLLTFLVALATLVVAVVPIYIRNADTKRTRGASRQQLAVILRTMAERVNRLAEHPRYAKEVLTAGLDGLFSRTLEPDVAEALNREEMAVVYGALEEAYATIVEAADRERRLERATAELPFWRDKKRFRNELEHPSDAKVAERAGKARSQLRAASELFG